MNSEHSNQGGIQVHVHPFFLGLVPLVHRFYLGLFHRALDSIPIFHMTLRLFYLRAFHISLDFLLLKKSPAFIILSVLKSFHNDSIPIFHMTLHCFIYKFFLSL
jgi:hypothetical protein